MSRNQRRVFPGLTFTGWRLIATVAMIALGGVLADLAPPSVTGNRARRPPPSAAIRLRATARVPEHADPVSHKGLAAARAAAASFVGSYLRVAYGRASATSVADATPTLRAELSSGRAVLAPAERGRDPRVVSVKTVAEAPGFVLATALVKDGAIATYALRVTVEEASRGWFTSGLAGG